VQTASPGVTHPWASVTSTSQTTLGAAIDPNQLDTKCSFDWGPTPSLLQSSPSTDIGAGTKAVPLTEDLSGLQPGTTYYWQVEATSAAGTVTSPVATFVTAGRAPSVTGLAATIDSPTSATLAAQVNPHAVGTQWFFEYGTTTSYGSQSPTVAGTTGNGTNPVTISTTVGSLTAATTYHYAVVAVNAVGKTVSNDHVFRTPGPPRVGRERVVRTSSSGQLFATINPEGDATTYTFHWGTSVPLANSTAPQSAGSGSSGVTETTTLSGLQPGTTYYWQVDATNAAGTVTSPVATFKTAGGPPSVSALTATLDSPTSATLTARVDAHSVATRWFFKYGTTTAYGSRSPTVAGAAGSGPNPVTVSTTVGSLTAATKYHYALVAVNALGKTVSTDHLFRTPSPPRVGYEHVVRTSSSGQLFATINPEGKATTYWFRWGTSWPLAHSTAPRSAGSGSAGVIESTTLSGLQPGTTYHWDVIAKNAAGGTASPGERFTTR
jgi:hypothetical protein